jgi:hypothetical protein
MKKLMSALMAAAFVALAAAPVMSVVTATDAAAWGKSKRCTDWCTNRHGQKFRIHH